MRTTAAQFKYFRGRVKHWAAKYGLHNVRVYAVMEPVPDDEEENDETIAWALYDVENSIAKIGLSPMLEDGTSLPTIDRSALHEVWEVMLWPMRELLCARGYSFEQVNAQVHDIIRRVESAQFGF